MNQNYNCLKCEGKQIYGPAIKYISDHLFLDNRSSLVLCYYSNNQNINFKYKENTDSIRRVCPCI